MKRISIERYKTPTAGYAGCIEGETDDGIQWIMFMDETGKPEIFWPNRAPDGGVAGRAIGLTKEHQHRETEVRMNKMRQILQDPDPGAVVLRLKQAVETAEKFEDGSVEVPERMWEIRDERIFGRRVSPEKPAM